MEEVEKIVVALIIIVTGILGIIINSTILTVYIRLWRKITSLGVTDLILFTKAFTGVLLQCAVVLNIYLLYFQKLSQNNYVLLLSFFFGFVMLYMSFWNTAWLSISYCVKLVNMSLQMFLQFKIWFSSSIKKLLIGSAVCSVMINLPLFWTADMTFFQNTNITDQSFGFQMDVNIYYVVFNMLVGYTLPCTLTLICIGLSVISLLHHIWRIQRKVSQSSSSPQLHALVRAAVTMTVLVVLNQTFLVVIIYSSAMSFNMEIRIAILFCLFLLFYPSIQSFVLIIGNTKLKRSFLGKE